MIMKELIKSRKGLASLFISLFTAILVMLLLSTIFLVLDTSSSATIEGIKIEKARSDESIGLIGPGALNVTSGSIITGLRVNNTGSIAVRIRALYIGHRFVCDPSEFSGDAYIESKESLWIQLYPNVQPPIILNETTMNEYWTVTTERGTRASETGGRLKWGNPWIPYTPNKFYFGPLMIVFDMFHWRSGSGPWRNGWTVPKSTKDVTWRILVVNVDDRDIEIKETSCLTLISNDNSPKDPLAWYIDPPVTTTTLKPGVFNFIYYTWNKPYSHSGASKQGITGMQDSTTCINFLTFFGSFIEANGTEPFGQTVPFEAVLVTTESMAASIKLTSNPQNIRNNGTSTSTITASVKDENGNPVPEAWVDFYTTAGKLSKAHSTTDANGIAIVTLTSTTSKTIAYVSAICQGVQGSCSVAFTPASKIEMQAVPSQISRNGGTSQIEVQLVDIDGQPVAQRGITVAVVVSWSGKGKAPILTYEEQSGFLVTVTTNSDGRAAATLKAMGGTGTATITASATGLSEGSTVVVVA